MSYNKSPLSLCLGQGGQVSPGHYSVSIYWASLITRQHFRCLDVLRGKTVSIAGPGGAHVPSPAERDKL